MTIYNWTKNEDGSESATYQGVKITIYQQGNLFGYYFDNDKNENNLGYTTREFAIDDAIEEINSDGS